MVGQGEGSRVELPARDARAGELFAQKLGLVAAEAGGIRGSFCIGQGDEGHGNDRKPTRNAHGTDSADTTVKIV